MKALSHLYKVGYWPDGNDISAKLQRQKSDVILLDLHISQEDPFGLLKRLKSIVPHTPVIVTSETEKSELVVRAVKQGAFDFVPKPYSLERIKLVVEQALEDRSLRNEIDYLRHEQDIIYSFDRVISHSAAMRGVIETLEKFSETDATILITGETGTGKELISKAIHYASGCAGGFVVVNVAGLDDNVFSDTLFGHVPGAFTGANEARRGLIEKASGGTLILDEIGDLSAESQVKLLRFLQDGEYLPLGQDEPKQIQVRVVAVTNKAPHELKESGTFRKDLYFRLQAHHIHIPPLRERMDDIPILVDHLLMASSDALKKKKPTVPSQLFTLLGTYSYPGNVRELENAIERAVVLSKSRTIDIEDFSFLQSPPTMPSKP